MVHPSGGPGHGVPKAHGGGEEGQEAGGQKHDPLHVGVDGARGAGGAALQGGEDNHTGGATQGAQRGAQRLGGGPGAQRAPRGECHKEAAAAEALVPRDGQGSREEGQELHAVPGQHRQQGQGPPQTHQDTGGTLVKPLRRPPRMACTS